MLSMLLGGAVPEYRNASHAFLSELELIRNEGEVVDVRGSTTQERRARLITISHPRERCIVVPHRGNDVFASAAETVWVLAGRNDLSFLNAYLPRAADFSDDGLSWRAGYGPRMRDWHGIDQLAQARTELQTDPASRRAVISLFDPASDYGNSLDVPCTNWLHFLIRNGELDLNVTIRSNDIWWGFSGINTFEWSVLLEAMAHWTGASVGRLHYFASSLHLYERHFDRADRVLRATHVPDLYASRRPVTAFQTNWEELDDTLTAWFEIEAAFRAGNDHRAAALSFPDPLLRQFLLAVRVKWLSQHGRTDAAVRKAVADLGDTDLAVAVAETIFRSMSRRGEGPRAPTPQE